MNSLKIQNFQSQLKKGSLEFIILLIISKGPVYTSDIIKTIQDSKLLVVEGTLYPLLSRLKNDNILSYTWVESKSGPPRKYYSLTEEGKILLEEFGKTWSSLNNSINMLIKTTEQK